MLKNIKKNNILIGLFLATLSVAIGFTGLFLGDGAETNQEIVAGRDANAVGRDQNNFNGVPHDIHDRTSKQLGVEEEKNRFLQKENDALQKENLELRRQLEDYLQNTSGDSDQIKALKNSALDAYRAGDYAEAEKLLTEALAIIQSDAAKLTAHIGDLHFLQSDFSKAENYYAQAANATKGIERSNYLAVQGKALSIIGKCKKAEPILNESLSIREKIFGTQNVKVAESLQDIALCEKALGKDDSAKEKLERAFVILKKLNLQERE